LFLRDADICNLEIFKVIFHQYFTMFPVLWPLLKAVFKILNRNVKILFTDDLMSKKHFPFSTHFLTFGISQKPAGAKSGEYTTDDPWQRCLSLLKTDA
jgi:hypothetical protein